MKKIFKTLASLALVAFIASCSHEAKFYVESFVSVGNAKYEIGESGGTLKIGVYAYPANGKPSTTVSFKVVDGTAKSGVNYSIEPASGVLTFEGDSLQFITAKVVDQDGVFTGDLGFTIQLESATNGYTISAFDKASVNIKDEDHPLLELFGEYTFKSVTIVSSGYSYATWTLNISPFEGDVTRINMDCVVPFFEAGYYGGYAPNGATVYADVNEAKNVISIPYPQEVATYADEIFNIEEGEVFTLYKHDGNDANADFLTSPGVITFTKQEDGSWLTTDSYGFATPGYVGDGWFYYYMSVFGGFNSGYPTFFVKN